jgi:hypothetical protein
MGRNVSIGRLLDRGSAIAGNCDGPLRPGRYDHSFGLYYGDGQMPTETLDEQAVNVAAFKARCLALIDAVA